MNKLTPQLLIVVAAMALALGCGKGDDKQGKKAPPTPTAVDKTKAPPARAPTTAAGRRVAIEVTNSSYLPAEIEAKAGEALTLVFTRTGAGKCGEFVKVGDSDVKTELPLDRPVEIAVKAPAAGELPFACGMDMMKGKIVVAQ